MSKRLPIIALALVAAIARAGQPPPERPTYDAMVAALPEMRHPAPANWLPTLYWWQVPLAFDQATQLKAQLTALQARGVLPCVEVNGSYKASPESVSTAVAQAGAIAAAGFPVHLAMKGRMDLYHLPDGALVHHADDPDGDRKDALGMTFPCLPMKDGWIARAAHLRAIFQQLAAAGVPVAGVWYDYEGHPHPWNGIGGHSGRCPSCKAAIPAAAFGGRESWLGWVQELRAEALATAFAEPAKEVFPDTLVGFYSYAPSSAEFPTMPWLGKGYTRPPLANNPASIDVAQPSIYANPRIGMRNPNPTTAYLTVMLNTVNNICRNLRADQYLMPFVSSCPPGRGWDDEAMYREFLRHAILRGARGFYLFTVGPPYGPTASCYADMLSVNRVCDELFATPCRAFLEGGEVMNDAYLEPTAETPVIWSGLRLGDRALVRVVATTDTAPTTMLEPFPGVIVHLIAATAGKSYIIDKSGAVQPLD